jgi:NADPH:quinone reductase-like Zn-dependent oxidoreductase
MAKVVRFHEIGGPEVLKIEEVDVSPPGKGEVQIAVKALGLNRAEVMFRTGQYISEPRLPGRPGYEAAGTVAAVGPDVQGFQVGDAVSVIPGFDLNDYGFYGDLGAWPREASSRSSPGPSRSTRSSRRTATWNPTSRSARSS